MRRLLAPDREEARRQIKAHNPPRLWTCGNPGCHNRTSAAFCSDDCGRDYCQSLPIRWPPLKL